MTESTNTGWIARLINREMADPTPAFDTLVEQGVRPRIDDLSAVVAEMLGCAPGDERVLRCVASIHAQWMLFVPSPIASRLRSKLQLRSENIDRLAEHIADFSLAGIRAVGRSG